jgi:hypothetical protein
MGLATGLPACTSLFESVGRMAAPDDAASCAASPPHAESVSFVVMSTTHNKENTLNAAPAMDDEVKDTDAAAVAAAVADAVADAVVDAAPSHPTTDAENVVDDAEVVDEGVQANEDVSIQLSSSKVISEAQGERIMQARASRHVAHARVSAVPARNTAHAHEHRSPLAPPHTSLPNTDAPRPTRPTGRHRPHLRQLLVGAHRGGGAPERGGSRQGSQGGPAHSREEDAQGHARGRRGRQRDVRRLLSASASAA